MSIFSIALPFPFYLYFPPALLSFSVWILWCKEWHDRTKRSDFIPSWSLIQAGIDLKLLVFSPLNQLVTLFWKGTYILVFWSFHLVCEEAFEVLFQISSMMFCVHYSGASISHFSFRDCNSSSWQWGSVLCHHPMVSLSSTPVHGGLTFSVILGLWFLISKDHCTVTEIFSLSSLSCSCFQDGEAEEET